MLHFMLIDGTKSSILILIIYITITTTIPLDIFSEVKNSNYNKNDLIYEITDKPLIELIVIGLQSGGNGLIQYQRIIIQHMIIQENSVVKNRKILYGSSRTFGHPVIRYCSVPAGNAILFPILNSECSYIEFPQIKNEIELRDCAKIIQDKVINHSASIDHNELKNLEEYRIQTSLFNFSLPNNNILGLPPQNTQAVADGNWVFLKPLGLGQHEIKFKGEVNKTISDSDSNFAGPIGWDYQTIYIVTIR